MKVAEDWSRSDNQQDWVVGRAVVVVVVVVDMSRHNYQSASALRTPGIALFPPQLQQESLLPVNTIERSYLNPFCEQT